MEIINMDMVVKIFGALGLLLITWGVLDKKVLRKNISFLVGGLFLLSYSMYIKDPVFIPLQIIFSIAALYEIYKIKS